MKQHGRRYTSISSYRMIPVVMAAIRGVQSVTHPLRCSYVLAIQHQQPTNNYSEEGDL